MNKQETTIVVLLFVTLLAWSYHSSRQAAERRVEAAAAASTNAPAAEVVEAFTAPDPASEKPAPPALVGLPAATNAPAAAVEDMPEIPQPEARTLIISNRLTSVTLSTHGACIQGVDLLAYRQTLEDDASRLHLDFSAAPALSMEAIPALGPNRAFEVADTASSNAVVMSRVIEAGVMFERTLTLQDGYALQVEDRIVNDSTNAFTWTPHLVRIGPMQSVETKASSKGISYLGVDVLSEREGKLRMDHWSRRLSALFGLRGGMLSACSRPDPRGLPAVGEQLVEDPVDWAAVKNKFFVQVLDPENITAQCLIQASRDTASEGAFAVADVSAALMFDEVAVDPGTQAVRRMTYYVGPKEYSRLRGLGDRFGDIMEFGMFGPVCKLLLPLLNFLYALIPSYGIAIIILTILVRLVFWPVTRKSTESMKKMSKVQPLVAEIRKKYQNDPQRMNQEVMALYRIHGVNPLAGCLPMLVQIPVFIALFTVLRSAVELRFAPFLWIPDLSEPEGLLAGMIPIAGSLNILPLFMTATMVWQQKLTPSAGDPQQQKMMMMMPVVMLFIFYSMPSALVLYWSTSQCLSILQLLLQKRKGEIDGGDAPKAAESGGGGGGGRRKRKRK